MPHKSTNHSEFKVEKGLVEIIENTAGLKVSRKIQTRLGFLPYQQGVFLSQPSDGEQPVVIKIIRKAKAYNSGFFPTNESLLSALIDKEQSKIIASINSYETEDKNSVYYINTFPLGLTDLWWVRRLVQGHMPTPILSRMIADSAEAISEFHGLGLVHCDVKPENLIVCADGHTRLTDLESVQFGNTQISYIIGTPDYVSPEEFSSKNRSSNHPSRDVYSLGLVIHYLFRGRYLQTVGYVYDEYANKCGGQYLPAFKVLNPSFSDLILPRELKEITLASLYSSPENRPTTVEMWSAFNRYSCTPEDIVNFIALNKLAFSYSVDLLKDCIVSVRYADRVILRHS